MKRRDWAVVVALLAGPALVPTQASAQSVRAESSEEGTISIPTPETPSPTVAMARLWGLEESEIERYREMALVERTFGADALTPYQVLGKYARSEEERMRYARRQYALMTENIGRTMEWAVAIEKAGEEKGSRFAQGVDALERFAQWREYLAENAIDAGAIRALETRSVVDRLGVAAERRPSVATASQGRVRLFVPLDCGGECLDEFQGLLSRLTLGSIEGLDVVFANSTTEDIDTIQAWAAERELPREEGLLTMHLDNGQWRGLVDDISSLPVAIDEEGKRVPLPR